MKALLSDTDESIEMEKGISNGSHDLLGDIQAVVRDCIKAGLIDTVSLSEFNEQVSTLQDGELEDYLQRLWDEI
jgi:hypothetical protein